eukprot:CAMPEP_0118928612 /NCGR_PEP_ID=MMETSP1169-20130426/5831_1 /TAXON_ID=36882 /ORGANISM="Pyramimonas obovata, Strain CCMP722" /LENGTH=1111 /DNA_ID=CAMNT_0006870639 /DNA_START=114 /DNA_END=3446 /DNA_ORIENTATION=-
MCRFEPTGAESRLHLRAQFASQAKPVSLPGTDQRKKPRHPAWNHAFSEPLAERAYQAYVTEMQLPGLVFLLICLTFAALPWVLKAPGECNSSLWDCDVRFWGLSAIVPLLTGFWAAVFQSRRADKRYTPEEHNRLLFCALVTWSSGIAFKGLLKELSTVTLTNRSFDHETVAWSFDEFAPRIFCSFIFNMIICHNDKLFFWFNVVYALMSLPSLLPYTVYHQGLPHVVNIASGVSLVRMHLYSLSIPVSIFIGMTVDKHRRHNFIALRKLVQRRCMYQTAAARMQPKRHLHELDALTGSAEPLVECYESVTVMFCTFTKESVARIPDPAELRKLMGRIYMVFDELVRHHRLAKVEHVCSDYVVCSTELKVGPDHAAEVSAELDALALVALARQMLHTLKTHFSPCGNSLDVKIGIHRGPLAGGIAGKSLRFFRIFGDTVNTAARVCQAAPKGRIQLSESAMHLVTRQVVLESTCSKHLKGKGMMHLHLVQEESIAVPSLLPSQKLTECVRQREFRLMKSINHEISNVSMARYTCLHVQFRDNQTEGRYQVYRDERRVEELQKRMTWGAIAHSMCFVLVLNLINANRRWHALLLTLTVLAVTLGTRAVLPRWARWAGCVEGVIWALQSWSLLCLVPWGLRGQDTINLISIVGYTQAGTENFLKRSMIVVVALLGVFYLEANISSVDICMAGMAIVPLNVVSSCYANCWRRTGWMLAEQCKEQNANLMRLMLNLVPSVEALVGLLQLNTCSLDVASMPGSWTVPGNHEAAILHIDMVGFTATCASLRPSQVLHVLHDVWCLMDSAIIAYNNPSSRQSISSEADKATDIRSMPRRTSLRGRPHEVFKMDTVGDAYIVAGVVRDPTDDHCNSLAFDFLDLAETIMRVIQHYSAKGAHGLEPGHVQVRSGLALGPVSMGLLGLLQPRFHMYGKAMDRAARAESQAKPFFLAVEAETMRSFYIPEYEGDEPGLLDMRVDEPTCGKWQTDASGSSSGGLINSFTSCQRSTGIEHWHATSPLLLNSGAQDEYDATVEPAELPQRGRPIGRHWTAERRISNLGQRSGAPRRRCSSADGRLSLDSKLLQVSFSDDVRPPEDDEGAYDQCRRSLAVSRSRSW